MKSLILAAIFILAGCSTTVPVTAKFPQAPGTLVQESCPNLQKLEESAKLSDVAKTITVNYSEYYLCAVKLEAWQRWYREQKTIYESVK